MFSAVGLEVGNDATHDAMVAAELWKSIASKLGGSNPPPLRHIAQLFMLAVYPTVIDLTFKTPPLYLSYAICVIR